jgi:ribosome maturation factor RimP
MEYWEELRMKIEEYLKPIIRFQGYELIELNLINQGGKLLLRILLNRPGGITMGECVEMNKKLSRVLDKIDFIQQSYVLEVSSPGVDRPLKDEKELKCVVGRDLEFKLKDGRRLKGNLLEVKDGKLIISCKDSIQEILISDLDSAKQKINLPKE